MPRCRSFSHEHMIAEPEQTVSLTVLDSDGESFPARILYFSGRRIDLACPQMLSLGRMVKLTWDGFLVLGEIVGIDKERQSCLLHVRHFLDVDDVGKIRNRWR